ncbi:hypothetical protein VM636_26565 [Streptomyces sp. SCSIO 75703]|uniref:hypothetical protein n=1 Tax=unclassified Streptomyces TaxID=2593676 RepID=UPI0004BF48BA|nr:MULTISPECIES: hypothetical protein [unclassified Streptomyces]
MNPTARTQAWSTLAAALALPLLYLGGTHTMLPLSLLGLAVFTVSMMIPPLLRFTSRPRA